MVLPRRVGLYVTQQQGLVTEAFEKGAGLRVLAVQRSAPDQGQELVSCLGVLAENAQHGAGHSLAVHLLDASHNHTHVTGEQKGEKMKLEF